MDSRSSSANPENLRKTGTGAVEDRLRSRKTLSDMEEAAQRGTIIQDAGFRCGPAHYLAVDQEMPQAGQGTLFFPRLLHRLPGADRGGPAEKCRCHHGRAERLRAPRCGAIFFPGPASIPALPWNRISRGTPRTVAWRWAIAIGSGYLFPTTFRQEVFSDLTGRARRVDGSPGRSHGGPV